jgi:hypothetical protein
MGAASERMPADRLSALSLRSPGLRSSTSFGGRAGVADACRPGRRSRGPQSKAGAALGSPRSLAGTISADHARLICNVTIAGRRQSNVADGTVVVR